MNERVAANLAADEAERLEIATMSPEERVDNLLKLVHFKYQNGEKEVKNEFSLGFSLSRFKKV